MRCINCQTELLPGFSECFTCGADLPPVLRNANSPKHDSARRYQQQVEERLDFSSAAAALSSPSTETILSRARAAAYRPSPERAAESDYQHLLYRNSKSSPTKTAATAASKNVVNRSEQQQRQQSNNNNSSAARSRSPRSQVNYGPVSSPTSAERVSLAIWNQSDDELFPWRAERKQRLLDKRLSPSPSSTAMTSRFAPSLARSLTLKDISAADALALHEHQLLRQQQRSEQTEQQQQSVSTTTVEASASHGRNTGLFESSSPSSSSVITLSRRKELSPVRPPSRNQSPPHPTRSAATDALLASEVRILQERERLLHDVQNSTSARKSSGSLEQSAAAAAAAKEQMELDQQQKRREEMLPLTIHAAAFMVEAHAHYMHDAMADHRRDLLNLLRTALRERVAFEKAANEIRQAETFAAKASAVRAMESSNVMQENAELRFQLEEAHAAVERQRMITEQVAQELAEVRARYETTTLAYQSLGSPVQGHII